jgi:hypothetical protein
MVRIPGGRSTSRRWRDNGVGRLTGGQRQLRQDLRRAIAWQNLVLQNALDVRTALNVPSTRLLRIRMAFDNRICCFYEPSLATRIAFNMPGENAEKSDN